MNAILGMIITFVLTPLALFSALFSIFMIFNKETKNEQKLNYFINFQLSCILLIISSI